MRESSGGCDVDREDCYAHEPDVGDDDMSRYDDSNLRSRDWSDGLAHFISRLLIIGIFLLVGYLVKVIVDNSAGVRQLASDGEALSEAELQVKQLGTELQKEKSEHEATKTKLAEAQEQAQSETQRADSISSELTARTQKLVDAEAKLKEMPDWEKKYDRLANRWTLSLGTMMTAPISTFTDFDSPTVWVLGELSHDHQGFVAGWGIDWNLKQSVNIGWMWRF